jgi:hypothetical protein
MASATFRSGEPGSARTSERNAQSQREQRCAAAVDADRGDRFAREFLDRAPDVQLQRVLG